MTTTVFSLDVGSKQLAQLLRRTMGDLGLTEPGDLEAWLASAGASLFGRSILWVARQDRASDEQRSDLVGIDKHGDVLVAELKRGELTEEGVTQALAYAAEYARKDADDLAALFAEHSGKIGPTGLLAKAASADDARKQISAHAGADTELNESQVLVLIGEDFTAKALAICDYLNGASGEASFSIECWRYGLFETPQKSYYFTIEQILPPPSIRQAVDEKREASKSKKRTRDPTRTQFMNDLMGYLDGKKITATRSQGASYVCRLKNTAWRTDHEVALSVKYERPYLSLPDELTFSGDLEHEKLSKDTWKGKQTLEFNDVDLGSATFNAAFGDRLIRVVELLREAGPGATSGTDEAAPSKGTATDP